MLSFDVERYLFDSLLERGDDSDARLLFTFRSFLILKQLLPTSCTPLVALRSCFILSSTISYYILMFHRGT